MGSGKVFTLIDSYGHLLAWSLLLIWAMMTGGLRAASVPVAIEMRTDLSLSQLAGQIPEEVDLRRDPVDLLILVEGIGDVTARRIVAARQGADGFSCLCQILRIPGVPDGPLLEAGPWLRPHPCLPGSCRSAATKEAATRMR
ncbi:MAG: hypothetical protein AAEJ04_03440 [Planctomycetota bacterium]